MLPYRKNNEIDTYSTLAGNYIFENSEQRFLTFLPFFMFTFWDPTGFEPSLS